jgi:hypothetical protein
MNTSTNTTTNTRRLLGRAAIASALVAAGVGSLTAAAAPGVDRAPATGGELTIELVAEHPDRALLVVHSDETAIYAQSKAVGNGESFVALDTSGTIVNEAPGGLWHLLGVHAAGERLYLYGFLDHDVCGLAPLDLATLTLGTAIPVRADSSCGGGIAFDAATPTTVWVTAEGDSLASVDLATGALTPLPLAGLPEHYRPMGPTWYQGVLYVALWPDFDRATGETYRAADGSELPQLIMRLDPTGASPATVEGHWVGDVAGDLVVRNDAGWFRADPATLALTPAPDLEPGYVFGVEASDTVWSASMQGSELVVSAFEPNGPPRTSGSLATPFSPDGYPTLRLAPVGETLYVVVSEETIDNATSQMTAAVTRIYRVTNAG